VVEEGELVARARAGDTDAYRCLMLREQDIAFRAAYLITGNAADAEDAAQEGFVKAFYALDRFRVGSLFRPWLLRIVTNEALNRRRAADRQASILQRAGQAEPGHVHEPSPETVTLATETRTQVLSALATLSDDDRIVLAYRYLLDIPVAEIATILDCPQRTVRSRIARALKRLRTQLTADANPAVPDRSEHSRA
jgi:RNA polymerase sigma factor (sigma-70 family)